MTQTELEASPTTESTADVTDRRRPGRVENISPKLIPLLRGEQAGAEIDGSFEFDEPDQLSASRGVAIGVLLSAPIWVGLGLLSRWILS